MKKDSKHQQIVVRITDALNKKIEKAAKEKGLTKASWVRQSVIELLDGQK